MEHTQSNELIPHLFRLEFTKMTAVLSRHFGLKHIEVAEDIASETFLKATELWIAKGIPENPTAWLYTVAKNKAKDFLKRETYFKKNITHKIKLESEIQNQPEVDFTEQNINDSQLAMIFAVCNPVNSDEAQISLVLQILCGFSIEEIANAFFSNKETIKKRLLRARENLRTGQFALQQLTRDEIKSRLGIVLRTLYLLFNEGYFSASGNTLIRKDLCAEAMRLTLLLSENELTNLPEVNALLALQCFQASRFDARVNAEQEAVLFEEQDKKHWNQEMISKGNYFMGKAYPAVDLSKYHFEAGLAYWHTTEDEKKWEHILMLYNQLLVVEYSPSAALNRTFAFAQVYGNERAVEEALKLGLSTNHYYHSLLGFLYATFNKQQAICHYTKAKELTRSEMEKKQLAKAIDKLKTTEEPATQQPG